MRRTPRTGAGKAGVMLSPVGGGEGGNGTWLQQEMVPLGLGTLRYIRRGRCLLLGRKDPIQQPGKRWWASCQSVSLPQSPGTVVVPGLYIGLILG